MKLQELAQTIVESLVSQPDSVDLSSIDGDSITVFEVRVDKQDLGRVIGRKGRTAHAIRTILQASAALHNRRVTFDIIESHEDGAHVQDR